MMDEFSCKHHEGFEERIRANTARVGRMEKAVIWLVVLLVSNLATALTILLTQLNNIQSAVVKTVAMFNF